MSAPLLLECDRNGRVLWMSDLAHESLGGAAVFAATLFADAAYLSVTFRFTRVWADDDRVILTAEVRSQVASNSGEELLGIQSSFFRHYLQLEKAERQLSTRARRLRGGGGASTIRQVELERQRLGRELHTGVGQLLAAVRMQLELIAAHLPNPPLMVVQALDRVSILAADALEQVRTVSKRLHPPEWQRLTLPDALRQLWESSGIPASFEGVLELHPLPSEPDLEVKVLLYRAAQEALSNLMRHARATRVQLVLEGNATEVTLRIVDNGTGFDAPALFAAPANLNAGIGLRSIRDQAVAIGAKMNIESGPNGTKLELTAPYSIRDLSA